MIQQINSLICGYTIRHLCATPYEGHPFGCPNYGKRKTCPPEAPYIDKIMDLNGPMFVIWNEFDLASHVSKMKTAHPDWKDRQLYCCLYWQGTARKQLEQEIQRFCNEHREDFAILRCPEATGVCVTETMKLIGVTLEWPPINKAFQVAIAGTKTQKYSDDLFS